MVEFFNLRLGIFDISIITILILSCIVGYNNGFIKEITNLLIWLISLLATFSVFEPLSNVISTFFPTKIVINILSFIIPLCFFFLFFSILFKILFNNLNEISNLYLNSFFGLLFGFFKGTIFIIFCFGSLIYLFNSKENFPNFFKDSYFFEPIKKLSINTFEYLFYFI